MLTRGVAHVICIAEHVAPRPLNADHLAPRTLSTLNKQVCICGCQAELPKTQYFRTKKTQATATSGVRSVAAKTFNKLWQTYCPNVLAMKPRSDLCWTCQQNSTSLLRSANLSEDDKSATVKKAEQHLNQARAERAEYQAQIKQCKQAAEKVGLLQLEQPGNAAADRSRNFVAHYSFRFCTTSALPIKPSTARTHLLQNAKEVWSFRSHDRGTATDGSFPDR